jgi:hypothetical protein
VALAAQSAVWIVLAALAGGVPLSVIDWRWSALAIGIAAVVILIRAEERFVRTTTLAIAAITAFSLVVYAAARVIRPAEPMGMALIRTGALAALAASLALLARLPGAIGLARAVLVIGGLKLLAEDVRIGSALMLVAAFGMYGGAMLIVGRCALRHTRTKQAIQVTEAGEQTMQSAN